MKDPKVRKLTEREIAEFPGDTSVNVAIRSGDGVEYYGDACADYPDGDEVAQFVTDEDGDYIPVSRFEKIAALAHTARALEAVPRQVGTKILKLHPETGTTSQVENVPAKAKRVLAEAPRYRYPERVQVAFYKCGRPKNITKVWMWAWGKSTETDVWCEVTE